MDAKESFLANCRSVLIAGLAAQSPFIVNPALAGFAEVYPDIPYSAILLISTLPSLICIPAAIIGGSISGSKVTYKTVCLTSISVALVAGALPFFLNSFPLILVSRAIFGVGFGIFCALANALPTAYFPPEKASPLLGYGISVQCLGGMIIQNIAGFVCARNVNATWLVHLYLILPILLILFFLPKLELTAPEAPANAPAEKQGGKLPASVYLISIGFGVVFLAFYPLILNMSSIITGEELGTAANAGTVLSMYSVGGLVSGLLFDAIYRRLRNNTIPAAMALLTLSLLLCYVGHSLPLMLIATALSGFAILTIMPAIIMAFSSSLPPAQVATASGIMTAPWSTLACSPPRPLSGCWQRSPAIPPCGCRSWWVLWSAC